MQLITDERAEDLAIFYQKIYNQFRRKGLSVDEGVNLLTLMLCCIIKRSGRDKEEVHDSFDGHWEAWEDYDR